MNINGIEIDASKLFTKQEILDALDEGSGCYVDLEDIRNRYHEMFGNELMWNYPISADLDVGAYIVAVKEGFLCLPYNSVETDIYEVFQAEHAALLDGELLKYFIVQWNTFSADLLGALGDMLSITQGDPPKKHIHADAIEILSEAAKGERMKAAIGGRGSLAESYCNRKADDIQLAIMLLETQGVGTLPYDNLKEED